jgi:hypothetical protein
MVDFGPLGQPLTFPQGQEQIDLRNEPGLRIWIRHDDRHMVLTTQFHHAVCDGIGAYQFLGDVLLAYANRLDPANASEFAPLSILRLRNRKAASYNPHAYRTEKGRWQNEWSFLLKTLSRVVAIRPSTTRRSIDRASLFPGILSYEFDKGEHRRLRLAAQARGQTINDLLMEKLFETLNEWKHTDRHLLGRGRVCVMMPLDLREPSPEKAPACNIVTYAFVKRSRRLIEDSEKLINSLREEAACLKHTRHQSRFMNLIVGALTYYPRCFNFVISRNRCLASVVLSNTGDPTKRFLVDLPREKGVVRCGNLLLTDITGVPPMRVKTRATISVFTYRRVLKICLRCDPNLFQLSDTQELLDQYIARIGSILSPEDAHH